MANPEPGNRQEKRTEYWLKNKLLIAGLLLIWAFTSFGICVFLAEPLSDVRIFEISLSFWFAQQGTMMIFVVLIFVYAWYMDHLDDKYDVKEVIIKDHSTDDEADSEDSE